MKFDYYCLNCGWGNKVGLWSTKIGERFLCYGCGSTGLSSDDDAPKYLPIDSQSDNESDYDFVKRIFLKK